MLEAPQVVDVGSELGGYTLVRALGEGGFGTVFLGEDGRGRQGAVKVMHPRHATDADFRERFAREVELARQVSSFCTARVLGAAPHGSPPWVVTEYVAGQTLARAIAEEGPYEESALYRIAVSTATALAAIHAAGVVHRDFKPENIMVAPDGARVIDFGIARALEGTRASASALIGTPRYMAPEQFEGKDVTTAIDLFAWGAVIAYAATGADAFAGSSQASVMHRVLMDEPDLDGVPASLRPVLERCLAKDPAERPSSRVLLGWLLGYEDLGGGSSRLKGVGEGAGTTEVVDHGVVLSHGEGVGTGRISLPPRASAARPEGDAGGRGTGVPDGAGAGVGSTPDPDRNSGARPFLFQGREYVEPFALAEAMQVDWGGACAAVESAPQRQALRRWLPADSPVRALLARRPISPEETDRMVAHVIAHMGPELSPVYRDLDMGIDTLFDENGALADWTRQVERLWSKITAGLLEPLSLHHCTDPDGHGCVPGRPCERYIDAATSVREAHEVVEAYRAWSREASAPFTDDRLVFEVDVLDVLNEVNVEGQGGTVEELVELATLFLPRGRTAAAVSEAVRRVPDERRRLVAAVLARENLPLGRMQEAKHDLLSRSKNEIRIWGRSIPGIGGKIIELEQKFIYRRSSFLQIGLAAVCLLVLAPIAAVASEVLTASFVAVATVLILTSYVTSLRESDALPGFDRTRYSPAEGLRLLEQAEARLPEVAMPGSPYAASAAAD
ncbi:serine/threonine protein kinase [Nocardiopsis sp. HNM0947]|uniref:Serine/threonine protein kinase n=1 Tax=Nocardiopsis coralli TaxID=2772213 RepID=A0ABR9PE42_9ACTN|nr:serine/threonine-protein kinase [Nocardiopsis coralli]MBE3002087.1 serine/threonine protein kinase [Nocardiopsis coralli]